MNRITSRLWLKQWTPIEELHKQRSHCWCHMKLLPSRRKFCVHQTKPCTCHFMQSHIRKVHACLAVTCHLHSWQNDWDLLRAAAVTWRWNRYWNKSQHRKLTLEKKILPTLLQGHNRKRQLTVEANRHRSQSIADWLKGRSVFTDSSPLLVVSGMHLRNTNFAVGRLWNLQGVCKIWIL